MNENKNKIERNRLSKDLRLRDYAGQRDIALERAHNTSSFSLFFFVKNRRQRTKQGRLHPKMVRNLTRNQIKIHSDTFLNVFSIHYPRNLLTKHHRFDKKNVQSSAQKNVAPKFVELPIITIARINLNSQLF